jgi:hypothetical protein
MLRLVFTHGRERPSTASPSFQLVDFVEAAATLIGILSGLAVQFFYAFSEKVHSRPILERSEIEMPRWTVADEFDCASPFSEFF